MQYNCDVSSALSAFFTWLSSSLIYHEVSVPIGNSWHMKLSVLCFCFPFFLFGFVQILFSRKLQCITFLHDPMGIRCTLIYNNSWFPCGILPMLHPNWCPRKQFLVLPLWLVSLPPDKLLVSLMHFWCTQHTGQLGNVFLSGSALCHQLQR